MKKTAPRKLSNQLLLLLLMFCITLVSSAPPVTETIARGIDIIHPETPFVKLGEDLEFNFWTYQELDGRTLTNVTLNCTLYIIDEMGVNFYRFSNQLGANGLITYGKGAPLCANCWTMIMPNENLSIQTYSYQIKCQGKDLTTPTALDVGGYTTGGFEVTNTGKELNESKTTLYCCISVISILIFLGLLWIGIVLPSKNKSDEFSGYILAVSNLKYLKYTLLGISYITLVWIMYFFWMISYAYLDFEFLSNIFRFMFTFLAVTTLPLFILFAYLTITNLIRDSQVGDALMRGLRVK